MEVVDNEEKVMNPLDSTATDGNNNNNNNNPILNDSTDSFNKLIENNKMGTISLNLGVLNKSEEDIVYQFFSRSTDLQVILAKLNVELSKINSENGIDLAKPLQKAISDAHGILSKHFSKPRQLNTSSRRNSLSNVCGGISTSAGGATGGNNASNNELVSSAELRAAFRPRKFTRGGGLNQPLTVFRVDFGGLVSEVSYFVNQLMHSIQQESTGPERITWSKLGMDTLEILDPAMLNYEMSKPVQVNVNTSLYVNVAEAKNLPVTDILSSSIDGYIVVSVDEEERGRTRTIAKKRDPMWMEEWNLAISPMSKSVIFRLYDEGRVGHDPLVGEAVLLMDDLKDGDLKEQWVSLLPKGRINKVSGRIRLRTEFVKNKQENLIIWVEEAKDIIAVYCTVKVYPSNNTQKAQTFKTTALKKTHRNPPVWGEKCVFQIEEESAENYIIEVNVFNKSRLSGKDLLGLIQIPLSSLIRLDSGHHHNILDKWHNIYPVPSKHLGSLRVALRLKEYHVLPAYMYKSLIQLIKTSPLNICQLISDHCENVVERKLMMKSFISVLEILGMADTLVIELIAQEINLQEESSTLFRANSLGSICCECIMKLLCTDLLSKTIEKPISELYELTVNSNNGNAKTIEIKELMIETKTEKSY